MPIDDILNIISFIEKKGNATSNIPIQSGEVVIDRVKNIRKFVGRRCDILPPHLYLSTLCCLLLVA